MMNPEVDQVISRAEQAIHRDLITSSPVQDIKNGQRNYKTICFIFLIQFLRLLIAIQSLVTVLVDDQSPWHFYVLNYFLGFGILGKVLAGLYVNASGMCSTHSMALLSLELKG